MAPTLYMTEASPPCRSVLLTAKAIGLELELKLVNLLNGDHMTPEYLKINPQHTIPTLVDGSAVICESHAICGYLINKYSKDDTLYPKDPVKRAVVDQFLHFDTGVLFSLLKQIAKPIYQEQRKHVPEDKLKEVEEAYTILEKFLAGKTYVTGENVTIADFCLIATVTSLQLFANANEKQLPNIINWMKRCSQLSNYSANSGVNKFYEIFKTLMGN